jgi:hypothetical protein
MTILSTSQLLLAIEINGGMASRQREREREIDQIKRWMVTRAAPQTAPWIEVGELLKGKLLSTELWLVQKATDEGPLKRSSHRSVQYDSSTDKASTISCRA